MYLKNFKSDKFIFTKHKFVKLLKWNSQKFIRNFYSKVPHYDPVVGDVLGYQKAYKLRNSEIKDTTYLDVIKVGVITDFTYCKHQYCSPQVNNPQYDLTTDRNVDSFQTRALSGQPKGKSIFHSIFKLIFTFFFTAILQNI